MFRKTKYMEWNNVSACLVQPEGREASEKTMVILGLQQI